jgi:hypothetical protein
VTVINGSGPPQPGEPETEATHAWRRTQLTLLRRDTGLQIGASVYYRQHPLELIAHWGNPPIPEILELMAAPGWLDG